MLGSGKTLKCAGHGVLYDIWSGGVCTVWHVTEDFQFICSILLMHTQNSVPHNTPYHHAPFLPLQESIFITVCQVHQTYMHTTHTLPLPWFPLLVPFPLHTHLSRSHCGTRLSDHSHLFSEHLSGEGGTSGKQFYCSFQVSTTRRACVSAYVCASVDVSVWCNLTRRNRNIFQRRQERSWIQDRID